eukprot:92709_1
MSYILHILLVSHITICIGIDCINVESSPSCGCGTSASTSTACPDGYTIVGCGSRTLDASADLFSAQEVKKIERCEAYGHWGFQVYAIARCCDFSSYSVQCTSDDIDGCTSEQSMMGCSGSASSPSYYMGQWPGEWSDDLGPLDPINNMANQILDGVDSCGKPDASAAMGHTRTCCASMTHTFQCQAIYSDISTDTLVKVSCPSTDQFMTSCSGVVSAMVQMNAMEINSDDECTVRKFEDNAHTSMAIAICCSVHTLNPTTLTIHPTRNPSHPTIDPTKNPTFDPTVATSTIHPTREPSKPTLDPTMTLTFDPTLETVHPSTTPTADPTVRPSKSPTADPTVRPSKSPTADLTLETVDPTKAPNADPLVPEPSDSEWLQTFIISSVIFVVVILVLIAALMYHLCFKKQKHVQADQEMIQIKGAAQVAIGVEKPVGPAVKDDSMDNYTEEGPGGLNMQQEQTRQTRTQGGTGLLPLTIEGEDKEGPQKDNANDEGVQKTTLSTIMRTQASDTDGHGTLYERCMECGKQDFGRLYEGDGLFYCNQCWINFMTCTQGNA